MSISFAVQGECVERTEWLDLARRVEAAGADTLAVADHPGTTVSPFVALAAAAQVTERVRLATAVINAGAWEPLALAAEAATLDLVSDGRAVLGVGAGGAASPRARVGPRQCPSAGPVGRDRRRRPRADRARTDVAGRSRP